ncbi:MAG: M28 family peptidase [Aridibacter sp.]
MRKNLFALFIMLSFILPSAALARTGTDNDSKSTVTITAEERKMAEAITAEQLKDFLYFVASDEMEGRDTPSRGLDLTAKFIALNLKRWGLKPAGDDGTFFQKMMIRRDSIDAENTKISINGKDFVYNKDFYLLGGNGMGSGDLVFAKNGWLVKSKNIDAFAGVDVKDKIVVLDGIAFSPRGLQPPQGVDVLADLKAETKGTEWADPMTYAKMKGAKGILIVASPPVQSFWSRMGNFLSRGKMVVEGLDGTSRNPADSKEEEILPMMLVSEDVGKAIYAGEKTDMSSAFVLNKKANISGINKAERIPTQNVVALWEGSDPKLKAEMVAIGAHYDHVGIRPNAEGVDKIWNGADDDGSGTVAVLSIAEALSKAKVRPKRSVLFVWHAGEEKGLWGSEYFNKYPTVDIKNVVAQLNIDMIGRSKKAGDTNPKNKDLSAPDEIYVIGSEMMSSTLGAVTKETNAKFLNMNYNYRYDDPKDTNRFFFRSDHFNYAHNGIPIVFWFDGVHEDYHGAGDEPQKIDYQKMEKVTRTIFLTLWEIAQLDKRPAVDKELPAELTRRN